MKELCSCYQFEPAPWRFWWLGLQLDGKQVTHEIIIFALGFRISELLHEKGVQNQVLYRLARNQSTAVPNGVLVLDRDRVKQRSLGSCLISTQV
jgi:hypothetical protein